MRFMEMIRKKGGTCLGIFLAVFLVSVFAGLGISGGFSFRGCSAERPDQQRYQPVSPMIVTDVPELEAVLLVNGAKVSERDFFQKIQILTQGRSSADNPGLQLQAYGYATNYAISEEIIAAQAEVLNVVVEKEDIQEAKDQVIDQQMAGVPEASGGNVIGDAFKSLDEAKKRKKVFNDYLRARGLSPEQWETQARLELIQSKTQEAWQEKIDAEVAIKADETKAEIDQRLADGESFEALALEFSEDPNLPDRESIDPFWLSRGLVLKAQEDAAFDAEDGTITDWIEVPAGWHRFEVLDHKIAEGEEFEAERENIITALKTASTDEEYEPTEEQIANKYEQVQVRQLMLKTSKPGAVNEEITKLVEKADIQINNPYILAYQALYNGKLQPPHSVDLAQLTTFAELAPVGEGYDFGLIQEYLDATAEAMSGESAVEDAPVAGETTSDHPALADETAEEVEDEELPPNYALAVGLLKVGLQDVTDEERATYFHYYIVGQTMLDWLGDEEAHDRQPIDRDAARTQIEDNLSRAAEYYEYSAPIHSSRGLNLAWLGEEEQALASLDLAIQYGPADAYAPIYEDIKKAYEVLDNNAKLEELDGILAEFRQAQLQAAMEQAQAGQGGNNVVSIPPGGDIDDALEQAQQQGGGMVTLTGEDTDADAEGEGDATEDAETSTEDAGKPEPAEGEGE